MQQLPGLFETRNPEFTKSQLEYVDRQMIANRLDMRQQLRTKRMRQTTTNWSSQLKVCTMPPAANNVRAI